MSMDGARPPRLLTVKDGAARVGRSRRTIEEWIALGLLNVTVTKNSNGRVIRRYVEEGELFAAKRDMLKANPSQATRDE